MKTKTKTKTKSLIPSIAFTLFLTSVCMIVMAEASYLISSKKVNKIANDYYHTVTEQNSEKVFDWFNEQSARLESHVFALEQMGVDNKTDVKGYLVNLLESSNDEYVYDVYFTYKENIMLCGTDFDPQELGLTVDYTKERDWYIKAVESEEQKVIVTSPYLDSDTNKIVVTLSERVVVEGEIKGTLAMDMFISSLSTLINGEMMPDASYGFLVDSELRAVTHPSEQFLYDDEPPLIDSCGVKNYDLLKKALEEGKEGISFKDYDGKARTFYFQELPNTNWFVVTAIDNNLVNSETTSLRRTLFIAAAVILVVSLVLEFIVRRFNLNRTIKTEKALERLKVEEEHRIRLEEAKEKAEAANRSKTSFLFNMSHDIRTPMNAIVGFTNIAIKHIDEKEVVKDSLLKTKKSSELLLSLINDILEMSRIESGKKELVLEKGNINDSFKNIDFALMELAKAKDIELTFDISNIKDQNILVDKTRFNRIFLNLGTNAIKYTQSKGKVEMSITQFDRVEGNVRFYKFTVKDNGMGMSEEFQKHMFEEFTREINSTKSGIQGTGLGLSVTKAFVDIMGGSIECESKQSEGTTFNVVLPFEIYFDEENNYKEQDNISSMLERLKNKHVLLVEDNELNREIALYILTNEMGLIVETAEDGTVAVDLLKKNGPDFVDFILMDIQMPYMNGYDATRAIRNMYPDKHIPIVALSANAFAEDKQKSLDAGMDDHVEKPIIVKNLIEVLNKLIK